MLVRRGGGGRGTPFAYTATAKGRGGIEEARQKLDADAELLRNGAAAAATAAGAVGAEGDEAGAAGAQEVAAA